MRKRHSSNNPYHKVKLSQKRVLSLLLPNEDLTRHIFQYLNIYDLLKLDTAILDHRFRQEYLHALNGHEICYEEIFVTKNMANWLVKRGVTVRKSELEFRTHYSRFLRHNQDKLQVLKFDGAPSKKEVLLIHNCLKLEELYIGHSLIKHAEFLALLNPSQHLKILYLNICRNIDSQWIKAICDCCPFLQKLSLFYRFAGDSDVLLISDKLKQLKYLNLNGLMITDTAINSLVVSNPNIELNLIGCSQVSLELKFTLLCDQMSQGNVSKMSTAINQLKYYFKVLDWMEVFRQATLLQRINILLGDCASYDELTKDACELVCLIFGRCVDGYRAVVDSTHLPHEMIVPGVAIFMNLFPLVVISYKTRANMVHVILKLSEDSQLREDIIATNILNPLTQAPSLTELLHGNRQTFGKIIKIVSNLSQIAHLHLDQFLPTLPFLIENFKDDEFQIYSESALNNITKSCFTLSEYHYHLVANRLSIAHEGLLRYIAWGLSQCPTFSDQQFHLTRSYELISHIKSIEPTLESNLNKLVEESIPKV